MLLNYHYHSGLVPSSLLFGVYTYVFTQRIV